MKETLEIQKIKLNLKQWELGFQEKHGTKPTKGDIKNAPQQIKDWYHLYAKNRSPKSEKPEVWGSHLNKVTGSSGTNHKQAGALQYYSNKLKNGMCNSQVKSSRENSLSQPKKEQPFDETKCKESASLCTQTKEDKMESPCPVSPELPFNNEKVFRIIQGSAERRLKKVQPLNAIGIMSDHHKLTRRRSSVSIDWIERCSQEDSPKELEHSDINTASPKILGHLPSRDSAPCLDRLFSSEFPSSDVEFKSQRKALEDSNLCVNNCNNSFASSSANEPLPPNTFLPTTLCTKVIPLNCRTENAVIVSKMCVKSKESVNCVSDKVLHSSPEDLKIVDSNLSIKNTDADIQVLTASTLLVIKTTSPPKPDLNTACASQTEDTTNIEVPVVKSKRKRQLSDTHASCTSVIDRKKKRLKDKMNSGTANENFVRIDLKKKVYTRGKKQFSGAKYKRQQWKNRQRFREATSNGAPRPKKGACFKCGVTGHWATNCPQKKEVFEELVPENDEKDDCPFLSLEEAAALAKGIKPNSAPKSSAEIKAPCETRVSSPTEESVECNADEYDFLDEPFEMEDCNNKDAATKTEVESLPTSSSTPLVPPLFELNTDGSAIATPEEVYKVLSNFGYKSFRPGQEAAVMRTLSGRSTLLVLATGAGKSLCYQLPAYMYAQRSNCITLVISPLVSLMEDQVTGLPACLKAVCLHTGLSTTQRQKVCDAVAAGKVHILLISPEAAVAGSCLPREMPPVAFACIDEAHCVSQWSHNFRPSYLRLCKVLRDKFGVKCIIGMTATATKSTAHDIAKHLGIADDPSAVVHEFHFPENLFLSVSRDQYKDEVLVELLKGSRFSSYSSIIVYCTRREQTERIATYLRTRLQECEERQKTSKDKQKRRQLSWTAEAYHAGLTPGRRRTVQNLFMSGKLRIVVATVAFGMGLDKADVRGVIHYNLPKSFESYVQEIGRAGRDGLDSHCHLFLDSEGHDICELRRHIFGNSCDRSTLRKLLTSIFHKCKCKQIENQQCNEEGVHVASVDNLRNAAENSSPFAFKSRICPGHEVAVCIDSLVRELDLKQENIATLLCYLELAHEKWVEVQNPVYSTCTIRAYGGCKLLKAAARKCPPLAAAIAIDRLKGISHEGSTEIAFPVVAVASQMGWDSGIVKRELKALEWNTDLLKVSGRVRKSGIIVEFSDLSFRLKALGDLSEDEQDSVLNYIHGRVVNQETTELLQLRKTFDALRSISFAHYWSCCDEVDIERSNKLKDMIGSYFEEGSSALSTLPANQLEEKLLEDSYKKEEAVRADVRQFVCTHSDHSFTGRAVARIFSGIPSPCYPSEVWGRVRRHWRCHMDVDFNLMCKWAAEEIIRLK